NIIDRLRMGEVVDFIDVGISPTLRWPVFNLADSAITIGLIIYFIIVLKGVKKGEIND
ncbi:MAG: signal peptidase II, partial [Candidatus Hydrothermae bacterium]|nr:signal peptidase II [Candidatus Hydrothermae bacterium]